MSDETVNLTLRIPKWMHEKLTALARDEHRSLNGEAVWLLAQQLGVRK